MTPVVSKRQKLFIFIRCLLFQKNIDNDIGTKNNLVSVRKSDFEVFQALAKDIEEGGGTTQKEYSQVSN